MKIAVIRFSSIGDIVLVTPAIRCLRKRFPDAEIHFVTKKAFAAVTEANPYISRFHYYADNLPQLIGQLQAVGFDAVVDLQRNARSWRIKRALGVPAHSLDKLNLRKFLLTTFRINLMPARHLVQRNLDVVRRLGAEDDGLGLDYFIPERDAVPLSALPETHRAGYVAVVVGASYPTKKMPVHKLRALCAGLGQPVLLLGGPEEQAEGEAIAAAAPDRVFNACGRFRLNQSADLVRQARLVISHDTGLQHIAAAFQKPIQAVWGSTAPVLGMEPYYGSAARPLHQNVLVPGLWCRPCSKLGHRKCPLGHFNCMEKHDVDTLVRQARQRL